MRAVSRTQQAATAADSSSSAGGVWRADAALQAAVLAAAALLSGGAPAAFADEALAAAEQVVEGPFAGYSGAFAVVGVAVHGMAHAAHAAPPTRVCVVHVRAPNRPAEGQA
jgi:hypothetical protein